MSLLILKNLALYIFAAGRRGAINIGTVLRFVTCQEEEPLLGYSIHPTIVFLPDLPADLPQSNTCINRVVLPVYEHTDILQEYLFGRWDLAFCQTYFGLD